MRLVERDDSALCSVLGLTLLTLSSCWLQYCAARPHAEPAAVAVQLQDVMQVEWWKQAGRDGQRDASLTTVWQPALMLATVWNHTLTTSAPINRSSVLALDELTASLRYHLATIWNAWSSAPALAAAQQCKQIVTASYIHWLWQELRWRHKKFCRSMGIYSRLCIQPGFPHLHFQHSFSIT